MDAKQIDALLDLQAKIFGEESRSVVHSSHFVHVLTERLREWNPGLLERAPNEFYALIEAQLFAIQKRIEERRKESP
jgi:hypothetical protein